MLTRYKHYGQELILDLHDCDATLFNRAAIERFMKELCATIEMVPVTLHFWDDEGLPPEQCQTELHTKGSSAVQFILTSNITIHTLDLLRNVYLNVFACKSFDHVKAVEFCRFYWKGKVANEMVVTRR